MRNCDPEEPLASDDPRWEDLSPARGDEATLALTKELRLTPANKFVHAAFVSHRGAGKSTELKRLIGSLQDHYVAVYLEATLELNPFQIDIEDMLFGLAIAVEATMREQGTPLDEALLKRTRKWFEDVVSTTKWAQGFNVEAAAGVEGKLGSPFVGGLFGSIKALFRQESEYRTEVKLVLRKYPGTLLQSVNELLDAANKALGERSLLVVVDNLDRYSPEVIDKLLGSGADLIRKLRTSLILTPPISLLLQPKSSELDRIYSCHFLHATRLRTPQTAYDQFEGPGRDLMESALRRRIDLDVLIPQKGARDRLISASGGAMRELLDVVFQSALIARGEKIMEEDVERAVSKRKQRIRDLINANGWLDTLVKIAEEHQIHSDVKCMHVLFNRLAFKYNGEGWYDVHPLVAEIPEFERARRGQER